MVTKHTEMPYQPSLTDKLKAHYRFRKKEPLSPHFCNRISPPWYLATILGAWTIAQTEAFSLLYVNAPHLLLLQRLLSTFILFEIMVNWICLRYISSTYDPGGHENKHVYPLISDSVNQDTKTESRKVCTGHLDTLSSHHDAGDFGQDIFTVYIATGLPDSETGVPKRTAYAYWSWKPCLMCERPRPPRCHHCPVCRVCVLKRDHHCYFAGACIGMYNQRHFVVFNFWSTIGTVYAMSHAIPFLYYDVYSAISLADLVPPLALARLVFGYITFRSMCIIAITWSICLFTGYSTSFLYEQIDLLVYSRTSFERDNGIKICDSRPLKERLKSVFGKNWLLNFLIPMHTLYAPEEDPISWPTFKK